MDTWALYLSRVFLEYSPEPVYFTMVAEKFQIYRVKTTVNTFVSQKFESAQFYSCSQAKLSPRFLPLFPRLTGIPHSSRTAFSEDVFSWVERGGRGLCSWKNYQNWLEYWSQVLINSTIFATFTVLVMFCCALI